MWVMEQQKYQFGKEVFIGCEGLDNFLYLNAKHPHWRNELASDYFIEIRQHYQQLDISCKFIYGDGDI